MEAHAQADNVVYLFQYSHNFLITCKPFKCLSCGDRDNLEPVDKFGTHKHFCLNCGATYVKHYCA